jgi:hypothetical protein
MPDYDFRSLSPHEFEQLTRDLLQEHLGCHLESFTTGRDTGIDLRHSASDTGTLVVQCKHYANSSVSALTHHLRDEELPKIVKLVPARYVLVTSLGLTPQNKSVLHGMLKPFCLSTEDVVGRDDLNNLLGRFSDIERKHFKLWLTSLPVLQHVLHSGVFAQTEMTMDRVMRRVSTYVVNPSYERALDILDKLHYCVIAGIPGIGKTMLAEMLLVPFVNHNYEAIRVVSDISEALETYKGDGKQVFYYDDFLGKTSLAEKLNKNEEKKLVEFLRMVQDSNNTRFILTTREYILNQAKESYEELASVGLDINKCVVSLSDYSIRHRARILYNHIYFMGLPWEYVSALTEEHRYLEVVKHPNFNPRVVEWMTNMNHHRDMPPSRYLSEFMMNLSNPIRIWEHAYRRQITNAARHLLLVLASLPDPVPVDCLENAFEAFYKSRSEEFSFAMKPEDFLDALRELEGSFVTIDRYGTTTMVGTHDPSVRDFLEFKVASNSTDYRALCRSAVYFAQMEMLWGGKPGAAAGQTLRKAAQTGIEDYVEGVKSTFESENCRFHAYKSPSGGFTFPISSSLEERLVLVLRVAAETRPNFPAEIVRRLIDIVSNGWTCGHASEEGVAPLTAMLDSVGADLGIDTQAVATQGLAILKGDLTDIGGYERMGIYLQSKDDECESEMTSAVQSSFEDFYRQYTSDLLAEEWDSNTLRRRAEKLLEVGETLGVDVNEAAGELQAKADELQSQEEDECAPRVIAESVTEGEESADEDKEIRDMFGSLQPNSITDQT